MKSVVRKAASADTGATIAETAREHTDPKYPICILNGLRATDLDVSVDIRPIEGGLDRAGGIAVRLRDRNNYYLVRANALEQNVRLYRVVNGVRTQFAGVEGHVFSDRVQRLRLTLRGDHSDIEFAGKHLFEARDRTYSDAGGVALWSIAAEPGVSVEVKYLPAGLSALSRCRSPLPDDAPQAPVAAGPAPPRAVSSAVARSSSR